MTEKLYYSDSHIFEFKAVAAECRQTEKGNIIILDKTAFFPEGGGQLYDTGYIGDARVLQVKEKDGEILHYTDRILDEGKEYECRLDREQRLRRMQNHSGEHIVSGITHNLHGYENVGFHMGEEFMTLDFSGELTDDDIEEIERLANEAVRANLKISATFPSDEVLKDLQYRSKLELTHDIRIVEIPGIDICACCAPHVSFTGEVGFIKILTSERHRGGMRLTVVCGMDALDMIRTMQKNVTAISGLLSAKREDTAAAVKRVMAEKEQLKLRCDEAFMELVELKAEKIEETEENICVFENSLDDIALRELVNKIAVKTPGIAAAFCGNDDSGYKYIIASRNVNLRQISKNVNTAIDGRGGGSPEMITGRASAKMEIIKKFIKSMVF